MLEHFSHDIGWGDTIFALVLVLVAVGIQIGCWLSDRRVDRERRRHRLDARQPRSSRSDEWMRW